MQQNQYSNEIVEFNINLHQRCSIATPPPPKQHPHHQARLPIQGSPLSRAYFILSELLEH